MGLELWPPDSYPVITAPTPTVTGCTRNSTVDGLSTFTAQTPAVDATTTRLIRPIFVKGQGGVLRWSVTVTNTTGNLLTANQASVESDTTGFQAGSGSPSLAVSSTWAEHGTQSLKVTADDTTAEVTTTLAPLVGYAGKTVTFYGVVNSPRAADYWLVQFYDASANYLGNAFGSQIGGTGSRHVYSVSATVPADTTQVLIRYKESTTPADEFFVDTWGMWEGSGGSWALPGQRIVGVSGGPSFDVQQQVIFLDDDDAQVGRWTGQQRTDVTDGIILSGRLAVPRLATQAQLKVLSSTSSPGAVWTEIDSRLEQIPADDPYVPPAVDVAFGDVSPEGVAPPAPPAGLPGFEANSPARRSPQVRWCQLHDSIRPDLTPKKNAREV